MDNSQSLTMRQSKTKNMDIYALMQPKVTDSAGKPTFEIGCFVTDH